MVPGLCSLEQGKAVGGGEEGSAVGSCSPLQTACLSPVPKLESKKLYWDLQGSLPGAKGFKAAGTGVE